MKEVNKDEVARYYIECELDNIVEGDNLRLIDNQYHSNLTRLLEALSFTYRANSVFDYVGSDQYRWEMREVFIEDILLTGMGEPLTKIIYSPQVQQNPRKFVDYVKNNQNQESIKQLMMRPVPDNRQIILTRESDQTLKMLDGSHRLFSMIMAGETKVKTYVAVLVDESAKGMIGDATFLRLRRLWEKTNDIKFRSSIERTVVGMMSCSTDGVQAVKAYWISMAPNDTVKNAGEKIVAMFEANVR